MTWLDFRTNDIARRVSLNTRVRSKGGFEEKRLSIQQADIDFT